MTNNSTASSPLTIEQTRALAGDLLRELVPHIGDREAVNTLMLHWYETLGHHGLSVVSMAAVQMTFADCLTNTPVSEVPDDAIALVVDRTAA